jgi:hypothetical protein
VRLPKSSCVACGAALSPERIAHLGGYRLQVAWLCEPCETPENCDQYNEVDQPDVYAEAAGIISASRMTALTERGLALVWASKVKS